MQKLREECGVFGIYAKDNREVATTAYYGLFALQHRGQESCGIAVCNDGVIAAHKDIGLVEEVFTPETLTRLGQGHMAVGHVRYGTTGATDRNNAQPIVVNHCKGSLALAHNGNLVNSFALREELELTGSIFHTTSDTEVISYVITKERLSAPSIEEAVDRAMDKLQGAYSLVVMSATKLMAVRDPRGFRPLCYGQTADGAYIVASESCALDAAGASFIRDVEPGEIVVFDGEIVRSIRTHCGQAARTMCVFEYIYFARPDSVMDGSSVHNARRRAGMFLALEHPVEADVVVGVPDSGLDAALGYASASGIPYALGFTKNKYVGRTFLAPTQSLREDGVSFKLNPIRSVVKGKRVVLVDDSIVRGTTCRRMIDLLRRAGVREIHMRVSAPPFVSPCYYGTDIDSAEDLIATRHTVEEIARIIGVDSLGYLSLEHTGQLAGAGAEGFCTACFGGGYPTAVPSAGQKDRFSQKISRSASLAGKSP